MLKSPEPGSILVVIGTRPEAIKLALVIRELRSRLAGSGVTVCLTGQHRELVEPICRYFDLNADIDLGLMQPDQSLATFASRCLAAVDDVLVRFRPRCVIGQGDTTTVAVAAIAAFYRHIPFVHVEAGLRTHDLSLPYPEEFNRRVTTIAAAFHCAPTEQAARNLIGEGVATETVVVTGNPIVDVVHWVVQKQASDQRQQKTFEHLSGRRLMLVTCHRRENFGAPLLRICKAIEQIVEGHPEVCCVFPVHPNPNVSDVVRQRWKHIRSVRLVEPLSYESFILLLSRADVTLSDSGGIQEEAVSLRRRLLVLRDKTERHEAIASGYAQLVGTDSATIISAAEAILRQPQRHAGLPNPFGDGFAARRIVDAVERWLAPHAKAVTD
jgi:UDP-N-acetylglucosamine 2-epimerase (non-hydrolysing)